MSTKHLLIAEITPKEGQAKAIANEWVNLPTPQGVVERAVFYALDDSTVLELNALSSIHQIEALAPSWEQVWTRLGASLASDFRRQLLTFVEAPKDTPQPLPTTPYLQLRHVEVPPGRFDEYRAWRERTIFDVVRNSTAVEQFIAYHSVISTEPGVMFLSGFSVEPDIYAETFNSPRYQKIVQEAGDNFITGGERGLYTKSYRRAAV